MTGASTMFVAETPTPIGTWPHSRSAAGRRARPAEPPVARCRRATRSRRWSASRPRYAGQRRVLNHVVVVPGRIEERLVERAASSSSVIRRYASSGCSPMETTSAVKRRCSAEQDANVAGVSVAAQRLTGFAASGERHRVRHVCSGQRDRRVLIERHALRAMKSAPLAAPCRNRIPACRSPCPTCRGSSALRTCCRRGMRAADDRRPRSFTQRASG